MEISDSVFEDVLMPTAAFRPIDKIKDDALKEVSWEDSVLNPKNRLESFTTYRESTWLVFGVGLLGRQYFMIPQFAVGKPPVRIDVLVPSYQSQSEELRTVLQSNMLVASSFQRAASLPITGLLHRILSLWAGKEPDFKRRYFDQPFGSVIIVRNISLSQAEKNVFLVPRYEVERKWQDLRTLKQMWQNIPKENWPPTLNLNELSLVRQSHDAITLVEIPKLGDGVTYVFKSLTSDVKYLYHELKMLLSMPPHDNVVSRPLYLVTKTCRFGGKVGVCGFVMPYYPIGSLHRFIQCQQYSATTLRDRFRWAKQVTRALIHIQHSPMRYYDDLKPDNVIMREGNEGIDALLIDFDQRGGKWFSWLPPEVSAITIIACIATSETIGEDTRTFYGDLMRTVVPGWQPPNEAAKYDGVLKLQDFSPGWAQLNADELEQAQAFRLGKLLWCIFEWSACIKCSLSPDNVREQGSRLGFPEFSATPPPATPHISMYC